MPKKINQKEIFSSKIFSIKELNLEFENGKRARYQILDKGDSSLIVPITDDGKVVLIREYFAAIDERQLALPKGRIEKGKNELETAKLELQEETGFKANKLEKIGVFTMSPGYLAQKTHIFLARELSKSELEGDEVEKPEVVFHDFSDFEMLINSGQLTESRMIAALFLARRFLGK